MKKYITGLVMSAVLMLGIPAAAFAQKRYCNTNNSRNSRNVRTYNDGRYYNSGYNNGYYTTNNGYNRGVKKPNVYQRHRKAFNLAIGTGAGALIGALVGGKKGALIGGAAGLAGGAIVTAKQKPKNYYRYRY